VSQDRVLIDNIHKVVRQCSVHSWYQCPNPLAWQMIPLFLSECEALSTCIMRKIMMTMMIVRVKKQNHG